MNIADLHRRVIAKESTEKKFFLDLYPNSLGAYSIRQLSPLSTYCMRVRRESDNSEMDFGFVGGVLDTSSILSFIGSSNGFVTTWYDQSGNNRDFTQTTLDRQPSIVTSGILNVLNGNPVIKFDGVNDFLRNDLWTVFLEDIDLTILVVTKPNNSINNFILSTSSRNIYGVGINNQRFTIRINNVLTGVSGSNSAIQKFLFCSYLPQEFYVNSVLQFGTFTSANYNTRSTTIGARSDGGVALNQDFSEIIFYQQNLINERINIENNINSFYSLF